MQKEGKSYLEQKEDRPFSEERNIKSSPFANPEHIDCIVQTKMNPKRRTSQFQIPCMHVRETQTHYNQRTERGDKKNEE